MLLMLIKRKFYQHNCSSPRVTSALVQIQIWGSCHCPCQVHFVSWSLHPQAMKFRWGRYWEEFPKSTNKQVPSNISTLFRHWHFAITFKSLRITPNQSCLWLFVMRSDLGPGWNPKKDSRRIQLTFVFNLCLICAPCLCGGLKLPDGRATCTALISCQACDDSRMSMSQTSIWSEHWRSWAGDLHFCDESVWWPPVNLTNK